jgi:hypothetical protein
MLILDPVELLIMMAAFIGEGSARRRRAARLQQRRHPCAAVDAHAQCRDLDQQASRMARFMINAAASALQPPGDFPYDKDGGRPAENGIEKTRG